MWIAFALGASIMWGITYVFNEQVYQSISPFTSLSLSSLIVFLTTLIISTFSNDFHRDITKIVSSKELFALVCLQTIGLICAEILIAFSISNKNAVLSGLIEISYPLFIAIFSYLFLQKNELNSNTAIGGTMIFLGILYMYLTNK